MWDLLHFYKLFICLFTLLPPLPVLFFQLFLWPFCDFSPTLFLFFFYITLFYLSIHFFGWNMAAGQKKKSWSEWGASRVDLHNLWRGTGAQTQRETVPTSPRWTELSSPAQRLVTLTGFTAAEFTEGLADISVPTSLAPTVNIVYVCVCVWWETVASLIDSYKAETNAYVYVHTNSYAHILNTTRPKLNWRNLLRHQKMLIL